MMDVLNLLDALGQQITRNRLLPELLVPKGRFTLEHFRSGRLINKIEIDNLVVNEGKNHILNTQFNSGSQVTTWYMGLINASGYSAIAATDTMASHGGWTEITAYTQATRPQWVVSAASGQTITNPSAITFDINATGSVQGGFICTNNTKGGSTGTLWSAVSYSSAVAVANGDQIKNTYTITT
jgi:hypothetical protein